MARSFRLLMAGVLFFGMSVAPVWSNPLNLAADFMGMPPIGPVDIGFSDTDVQVAVTVAVGIAVGACIAVCCWATGVWRRCTDHCGITDQDGRVQQAPAGAPGAQAADDNV